MKTCTNNSIGRMLHAYELGTLNEEESRQFELHLYECEHCFEQLKAFGHPLRLVKHDPELRTSIRHAAEFSSSRPVNKLIKLLLTAAALILIAIPVYKWQRSASDPQILRLVPLRGLPGNTVEIDRGGDVEIRFVLEGADITSIASIVINSEESDVIYQNDRYSDFNDKGLGVISLPVSVFERGSYIMTIDDLSRSSSLPTIEYSFRVE